MKRKLLVLLSLLLQSLGSVVPSMAQTGSSATIPVEIEPTGYVTVSRATAVWDGDRLQISGVLTRPGEVHLSGHVDLLILGQDGALLEKRRISVPRLASHRGGRMEFRFGTILNGAVPAGSRALLRYHAPGRDGSC